MANLVSSVTVCISRGGMFVNDTLLLFGVGVVVTVVDVRFVCGVVGVCMCDVDDDDDVMKDDDSGDEDVVNDDDDDDEVVCVCFWGCLTPLPKGCLPSPFCSPVCGCVGEVSLFFCCFPFEYDVSSFVSVLGECEFSSVEISSGETIIMSVSSGIWAHSSGKIAQ